MKKIVFVILFLLSVQAFAGKQAFEDEDFVYQEDARECTFVPQEDDSFGRQYLYIESVRASFGDTVGEIRDSITFCDAYEGDKFSFSGLIDAHMMPVLKALQGQENLVGLSISNTYDYKGFLSDQGLKVLAAALKAGKFPHLKYLYLGGEGEKETKGLTAEGWIALFEALGNTQIEVLVFCDINMPPQASEALKMLLPQIKTLKKFSINGYGQKDNGLLALAFAEALPNMQLESLELFCKYWPGSESAMRKEHVEAVLKSLKGHSTMRTFSIGISDNDAYPVLTQYLPQTPITHFYTGCDFDPQNIGEVVAFIDVLPQTQIEKFIFQTPHGSLFRGYGGSFKYVPKGDLTPEGFRSFYAIEKALVGVLVQSKISSLRFEYCSLDGSEAIRRVIAEIEGERKIYFEKTFLEKKR